MKLVYLKSALNCDSFDATIGIKIPFFLVLVTIELGRSLLQFVSTNYLIEALIVISFIGKAYVGKNFKIHSFFFGVPNGD